MGSVHMDDRRFSTDSAGFRPDGSAQAGWPVPRLRLIEPIGDQREMVLDHPHAVIGRDPGAAVRLADPMVSHQHAALDQHGGRLWLTDLGSTNGTYLNGIQVRSAREVGSGDVIGVGGVRFVVETGGPSMADATRTFRGVESPQGRAADINNFGNLSGEIYQAGRDQYIQHRQYVQHLYQQRESFFAQIAATRTKARWLTWLGVLVSIVGIGICVVGFSGFLDAIDQSSPFGGVPPAFRTFFVGIAIGMVGQILLIIGIVLHVVATARKRRVSNDPVYRSLQPIRQH